MIDIEKDKENELKATIEAQAKRIEDMIHAWETLPEGNHSASVIQKWLINEMSPAINALRQLLTKELGE